MGVGTVRRKKVLFVSSSGGHFEQLKCLKPLMDKYDSVVVTEKTKARNQTDYYVIQTGHKDPFVIPKMALMFLQEIIIFLRVRPECIVTTGTICCLPFAWIAKITGTKFIFIESFAKRLDPTKSGAYIYRHNLYDLFIIQWESLRAFYPNAVFGGCIY